MTARFWGVRGSIPSPGISTVKYGGNTSCVSIQLDNERILVLDAGTGIRQLGKFIRESSVEIYILLSHNHWDHIHGFPFFAPIYQPNRKIYTFATLNGKKTLCSLIDQMDGAHFPVTHDDLPSQYECIIEDPMDFLRSHGFNVSRISINHPGGGYGYRVENENRSIVYITDNEIDPPYEKASEFDEFIEFSANADILIHDAQYSEEDMPHKHGWGHSLVSQVRELAAAAGVRHLILFHHDPDRTDEELDAIEDETRKWFKTKNEQVQCSVAFEGLRLDI